MPVFADIQWAMVSALAASAGVIVALIFQSWNLANTRLSNSAKMVLDLTDTFDSAEMRNHRGRFAKKLLEEPNSINLRENTPVLEFFEELGYMTRRGVLDEGMVWNSFSWWFEPYYLAVRGRVENDAPVGSLPADKPSAVGDTQKRSDLIATTQSEPGSPARKNDSSLFKECVWLYGRMNDVELREDAKTLWDRFCCFLKQRVRRVVRSKNDVDSDTRPSEINVRAFLEDEAKFADPAATTHG